MPSDIKVEIVKSSVPIIWLDTSIISYMTQWKHSLCNLDETIRNRIGDLYEQIYRNTRAGQLICPLGEQEEEVWIERDKWLDTIHSLTFGIETASLQGIHDNQFHIFMRAFVNKQEEVILSYKDIFASDPVLELKQALKNRFYVAIKTPVLFGAEYKKGLKNSILEEQNEKRKENVQTRVSFLDQLEKEYSAELSTLLTFLKQVASGEFANEEEQFNATAGVISLKRQLMMWANLTGKSHDFKGLNSFYESLYYRSMPYTNICCHLIARAMIDKQPIKSGDMMDIKHAATLMPYSDIFITDKAMSAFLRKWKFDKRYKTTVCYIGDTEILRGFFASL